MKHTLRAALISASAVFGALAVSSVQAHPIEYHMHPLEAATVKQVIRSLDQMADELRRQGSLDAARMPDGAMGVSVLLWSMQDALTAADDAAALDNPALQRTLLAAGYQQSPYMIEEWQADAEQVLETYEVLARGLDLATVQARYAALQKDLAQLADTQAIARERVLVRDLQLLRTTAQDREVVQQFRAQLDALVDGLGMAAHRQ